MTDYIDPSEIDNESEYVDSSKIDMGGSSKSSSSPQKTGSILQQLMSDSPQLLGSLAQFIPGPVGTAVDVGTSAIEHPYAFIMGGPSVNKMQEGANLVNFLKSSMDSWLSGKRTGNEEVFPSTGITSAKTPAGSALQMIMNLSAPFVSAKMSGKDPILKMKGHQDYTGAVDRPGLPKESEVSSAIKGIENKASDLESFYSKSNKYGADVIDNLAAEKISAVDSTIAKTDEALSTKAYEVTKKFRDKYYPEYNSKLSKEFSEAWDPIVSTEIDAPDINIALSDFGRTSGLYNMAQYSPESMSPIDRKILAYVNGVRERTSDGGGVMRMTLGELSDGFESILKKEYGKQWKTPMLDRFRRSFIDLAGDAKYKEMKAVKSQFKPRYQFREDMRPFFGKKKGEANVESGVNLFKGWASGDLQTKNPSNAEIIKKIMAEFGDGSLEEISSISKDRADLMSSRQAIISGAEADKSGLASTLLAKATNSNMDKNSKVNILNNLIQEVESRKSSGVLAKLMKYAMDKIPGSKEVQLGKSLIES